MSRRKELVRVYTVVDVMAGVAVEARSFRRRLAADRYAARISENRDLGEDDIRVFETLVALPRLDSLR